MDDVDVFVFAPTEAELVWVEPMRGGRKVELFALPPGPVVTLFTTLVVGVLHLMFPESFVSMNNQRWEFMCRYFPSFKFGTSDVCSRNSGMFVQVQTRY